MLIINPFAGKGSLWPLCIKQPGESHKQDFGVCVSQQINISSCGSFEYRTEPNLNTTAPPSQPQNTFMRSLMSRSSPNSQCASFERNLERRSSYPIVDSTGKQGINVRLLFSTLLTYGEEESYTQERCLQKKVAQSCSAHVTAARKTEHA